MTTTDRNTQLQERDRSYRVARALRSLDLPYVTLIARRPIELCSDGWNEDGEYEIRSRRTVPAGTRFDIKPWLISNAGFRGEEVLVERGDFRRTVSLGAFDVEI